MRISEALFLKYSQEELPSVNVVKQLTSQLAQAAQQVYDMWDQSGEEGDPELGFGGICQDIASAFSDILSGANIDCAEVDNQGVGEQHVWTIGKFKEGVYAIDIEPHIYESGSGYNWKKIPDVVFDPSMIDIYQMSSDPSDFEKMSEY